MSTGGLCFCFVITSARSWAVTSMSGSGSMYRENVSLARM